MSRYEIIICRSTKDETCVAEVPELAGYMADGEKYQKAVPERGNDQ